MNKPSSSVMKAIERSKGTKASPDKLDRIREKAFEAQSLRLEILNLEERLKEKSEALRKIEQGDLVDLMDAAGLPSFTLDANGNQPPMNISLVPYYSANIAASWPDAKRQEAFSVLKKTGNADLIKTRVMIEFPRGSDKAAKQFVKVNKLLSPKLSETVHSATLTAWLREQCEAGRVPPTNILEAIGGSVGRIVKVKEKKE